MKNIIRLLAVAALGATLLACQPTGNARCDAQWDILTEIEERGYTVDCDPGFDNVAGSGPRAGRTISGWADHGSKTVWIWPAEFDSDRKLRKTLWHELGHVTGIHNEPEAEQYSYCREPMGGLGYSFGAFPSAADCARLGA